MKLTPRFIALVIGTFASMNANGQSARGSDDRSASRDSRTLASPLLMNAAASADTAAMRTVQIGDFVFHVPYAYIDSWDGFQSKMGYIRMKVLLPCLEPKTSQNAAAFEKLGWGNTIVISIDRIGPSELTGDALLAVRLASAESYHRYVGDGVTEVRHHHDPSGFEVFDDLALFQDEIFLLEGSKPAFFFECWRHDAPDFVPFPSCAVRELVHSELLVQYRYSRAWIENDPKAGLTIDANVRKLIDSFAAPESLHNPPTRGVCQ